MKKLIRNISVLAALSAFTVTNANIYSLDDRVNHTEVDYESNFFEENTSNSTNTISPGTLDDLFGENPNDDPFAPIDDYIPFLLIGAAGVVIYYRKQLSAKI